MENKMENLELEEMRQQMTTLKQQLEKQVQVNDKLVVKQLKKNVNSLRTNWLLLTILGILGLCFLYESARFVGLSSFCFWFFITYVIVEIFWDFYITHYVKKSDITSSVSETLKKLKKAKKINNWGTVVDLVFSLLLFVWLCLEIFCGQTFQNFSDSNKTKVICVICVGVPLGFLVALWYYKSQIKNMDEMIDTINEIDEDNNNLIIK